MCSLTYTIYCLFFQAHLTKMYGNFSGTYDNVYLDGILYNVWKSISYSGARLYAKYHLTLPPKTNGSAVTLYGNGFIKHKVGSFSVNSQFSAVQLEFRTLKNNVVIFGVTGETGSFIYGLYIFGGKLMFQFATSLRNNISVVTTR